VARCVRAHKEHIMPTLQSSTHNPHRASTRLGAGLGALGALIAIGAIALIIALTGTEHAGAANGAIHRAQVRAHIPSVAVIPPSFNGFFQDPATHGVQRVRATKPTGWPSLASVLAPLTAQQRRYVLGIASLSEAQVAAAYGTGG
jgi:hypothetical protein